MSRSSSRQTSGSYDKPTASVTIEEDYLEFHGQIYYAWRAEGAGAWDFKLTPYKQLPYIRWKKLTQAEYNDRLRRYGLEDRLPRIDEVLEDMNAAEVRSESTIVGTDDPALATPVERALKKKGKLNEFYGKDKPMSTTTIENEVITALAKKFKLKFKDFSVLEVEGKKMVVQVTQEGIYRGSWDDIMKAPEKEWSIIVEGKSYDARKGMSWAVYKFLQDTLIKKLDKNTYTWLTGEPVPDWCNYFRGGGPGVPYGYWYDDQVKSYLGRADYQNDNTRPRLAVILDNSEISPSSEAPLPLVSYAPQIESLDERVTQLEEWKERVQT